MSTIIRTDNLTRHFGSKIAIKGLNLEVYSGEIFGLVGPDGAGKTTTLRLLCGLLDPTEGQVFIDGYNVTTNLQQVKDRIGYMAQRFGLYGDLTVEENMLFYADLFGIENDERKELMAQLLKMTRMETFLSMKAYQLSGGMKQKLALMCTLLHHPQVLFLDEPTAGVDPVSRRDFWKILYQLVKKGVTIFITTTYMDEAERCNRIGLIHKGCLIHCDSPTAMRNRIEEECYEIQCPDRRKVRELLQNLKGVLSIEPSGSVLHLFLSPKLTSVVIFEKVVSENKLRPAIFKKITPSLEDIFIASIRKVSVN